MPSPSSPAACCCAADAAEQRSASLKSRTTPSPCRSWCAEAGRSNFPGKPCQVAAVPTSRNMSSNTRLCRFMASKQAKNLNRSRGSILPRVNARASRASPAYPAWPVAATGRIWGPISRRPRFTSAAWSCGKTGGCSDLRLVVGAATGRAEVTIVPATQAVGCAHRSEHRSEAAQARQLRLDLVRRLAEIATAAAALLGYRTVGHCRLACRTVTDTGRTAVH